MMGGNGSQLSEIDFWIIHGFQQVEVSHLFPFLYLICLCLLVGPHPPNGCNPPLRVRISFMLRVLFLFVIISLISSF
jgi:hypothetical protein